MIRARSTTGVSAHCGSAAAADLTARSTSSAPQCGTRAMTLPDDGLNTSPQRLAVEDCHFPPLRIFTSAIVVAGFFASAVAMITSHCGADSSAPIVDFYDLRGRF